MRTIQSCSKRKASLEYPFSDPPITGLITEIIPGLFWLRMPLAFALDHINLWLIADGHGWTIVDCGYASDATRAAWEHILDWHLEGRTVTRVIVTHCHPDHVGLCGWLAGKYGLIPWITKSEFLLAHAAYHRIGGTEAAAVADLNKRHGLGHERVAVIESAENYYRRGVVALPASFHRIRDGQEIPIGDWSWRVIVGHGHAPEHAALYCEKAGILISGDMLLPRITTNISVWPMEPDGDPLDEFLSSLGSFRTLPPETLVLPSHGLPFRGMHDRIADLRFHHRQRLDLITDVCERPATAAQLLPTLFERKLDDDQVVFAMGETIAHLNHLARRGVLKRIEGPDGLYRFVRRAVAASPAGTN